MFIMLSLLPSVHCVLLLPRVNVIMFNVHNVVDAISLIVLLLLINVHHVVDAISLIVLLLLFTFIVLLFHFHCDVVIN
jgi:hypothetical protein